jgi:large subunit ribosomal protein L18e|tara:strand:- start:3230 stop:3586 length:357 start_codon:yes stop_codon:yes gene_type:complete
MKNKTNTHLVSLIQELKKKAIETDASFFKRLATDLEKPVRQSRVVNLTRINKHTKENEFIVVPGKVLGTGDLDHALTIAAYKFSTSAIEKINGSKSKAISLNELMNGDIKGKKIRIIG